MHYRPKSLITAALILATLQASAPSADGLMDDFVVQATRLNLFQISSSELAVRKGSQDETRTLAEEISNVHKNAQRHLADAASAQGVKVPASMDEESGQKLAALNEASVHDFDAAYMSTQISSYAAIGRLYLGMIKAGEPGRLRSFAEKTYPQFHMVEARVHAQSAPGALTDGEE